MTDKVDYVAFSGGADSTALATYLHERGDDFELVFADTGCAFDSHAVGAVADFDYEDRLVCRWWPRGRENPTSLDRWVQFGRPAVRGVATEALVSRYDSGDSIEFLAGDYGLTVDNVRAALEFEGVSLTEEGE